MDLRQLNGGGFGDGGGSGTSDWSTTEWVLRMGAVILLVVLAAIFSGLTLGYMSLDKIGLQIVIEAGDEPHATEQEKKNGRDAKKILKIRNDGHLLLTTLLFGNVGVNTILSIVMADMTSGVAGFLITTVLLVIFGELIPQALCSRHALAIGAKSIPVVWFFIILFYVFAKPIALCLDWMIGHDIGTIFTKRELGKMLEIHVRQNMLDSDETDIMKGAMHFKKKHVSEVMTPIEKVFTLPVTTKLDLKTIRDIYHQGYSRIPVWGKDKNDIVGLIFVKDLIFADPEEETTLLNFVHVFGRGVHRVWPDSTLGDVLQAFKMGRTHLALVHDVNNDGPGDPFYETKGVVTLEDIVEEILQAEIYDESDAIDAETHRKNRLSHRSYDPGFMHILDGKEQAKLLAKPEAEALAKHLVLNDTVFSTPDAQGQLLNVERVASILAKSHVIEFRPENAPHVELFTEFKVANYCLVVLEGFVLVSSGKNASLQKGGLWSVHGAASLLSPDGAYESDVTVEVPPDVYTRCVRISRLDFQATLYPMHIIEKPAVLAERRLEIQKADQDVRLEIPTPTAADQVRLEIPTPVAHFSSDMDIIYASIPLSTCRGQTRAAIPHRQVWRTDTLLGGFSNLTYVQAADALATYAATQPGAFITPFVVQYELYFELYASAKAIFDGDGRCVDTSADFCAAVTSNDYDVVQIACQCARDKMDLSVCPAMANYNSCQVAAQLNLAKFHIVLAICVVVAVIVVVAGAARIESRKESSRDAARRKAKCAFHFDKTVNIQVEGTNRSAPKESAK
ncbi:hypothetical protein LEN26_000906 [Aphanomyces euteiches]|nr:hypothetical protein LEN26_000906 [Aphanomyces euteiches]